MMVLIPFGMNPETAENVSTYLFTYFLIIDPTDTISVKYHGKHVGASPIEVEVEEGN